MGFRIGGSLGAAANSAKGAANSASQALTGKDVNKLQPLDVAKAYADPLGIVTGGGLLGGVMGKQADFDQGAFQDPTGAQRRSDIQEQMGGIQGRAAPTMDPSQQAEFRDKQMALANDLIARASGQGPSIAEESLKRTTEGNLASAMAMANSGNMPASAVGRTVGNQLASINQEAAGQASTLRLQEAENARSALAGLLAQGRGADIDIAGANLNADLSNRGLNDRMTLGLGDQFQNSLNTSLETGMRGQELGVKTQDAASQRQSQILGGLAQAGATAAIMSSDRRGKKNIEGGEGDVQSFLDALSAHTFEYKDKSNGEGKRVGVMAQDVEKSPLGKRIVVEGEDGKRLDFANALGAMMASSAVLNDRMSELEEALEMKHGRKKSA